MNWHQLRGDIQGSKEAAFEELCVQIARIETEMPRTRFVRLATPDGGVECYRILPDGTEHGWQAKYFMDGIGDVQFRQVTESFERALETHPRLAKYTVCIPQDRADPRIPEKRYLMDRWDAAVASWTTTARDAGRTVEFDYWGDSELSAFLAEDRHAGRRWLWFQEVVFTQEWFRERFGMTRRDAGERYDPSVNVPVAVTKLLSALLRETPWFDDIAAVAARMDDRARDCRHLLKDPSFAADTSKVLAAVEDGATRIETLGRRVDVPFNARSVIDALQPVGHLARTLMARLYSEPSSGPEYTASAHQSNPAALRELDQYRVRMLDRAVDDVIEFLGSDRARLAEGRPLVLTGAAGSGKTHLLCDAADGRIRDGAAAIVLLGQWFIDGEPFTQMLQKLDLRCSAADFLDALDSAGEARGRKALLVIDALNESRPRDVWHRHLAGIAETVSAHAWIGFVVSCRSTYLAETLPEGGLIGAVAQEHQGFTGDVGNAVRRYFDHYGIARPRSPLVFPEFRNPLFLRLFCRAMQNAGLAEAPEGIDGASAVFDFFIGAVEKTLSGRDRLDYLPQHRHAANAISAIVDSMITRGDRRLPLLDAEAIAEAVKPSGGAYSKSLLSGLMHEGVLVNEIGSGGELVAFQYERLGDHLLARRLLKDLTEDNLRAGIATEPVSHFLSEDRRWRSSGVIEALAVQLPERFGIELHDVTEHVVDDAFLASLVWRSRSAFSDSTLRRLEHLRSDNLRPGAVYDVLLMVAGVPEHRLNAEHLDAMLRPLSMIERDVIWTTYLNGGDDESGPRRLISWAAAIDEAQSYDRGALTLLTTALAWLLTASNRAVRDRATKALVEVFTQRLDVANDTLRHFADVNDPYVVERVAAAACGAALRSADDPGVVVLAKAVFERFFVSQDRLPVHLLTRDYLRLIVERAHFLGEAFPMDRVRPPYGSTLTDPPRLDELEPFDGGERGDPDANQGLRRAWYSVMHGDFALYVIGTNAGMFHWLPRPGTPEKRRPADIIESFQQRLNPRQRDAWHIFQTIDALNGFDVSLIADDGRDDPGVDVAHIDIDDADALERLRRQTLRLIVAPMLAKLPARLRANPPSRDEALAALWETLDDQVRADFDTNVLPALADASVGREADERFDLGLVQRFVFDYVIKTGYDLRLGAYDDVVDRDYDRAARILERIGKKYQWQGLHEYLARIADNCPFKDDAFPSRVVPYEGAWQTSFRDIDPTFIPQHDDKQPGENAAHWKRVAPLIAAGSLDGTAALTAAFAALLQTSTDPPAILVAGDYHWTEEVALGRDPHSLPRQDAWTQVRPYLVRAKDAERWYAWAARKDWYGRWMPESLSLHEIMRGEFYWAPAFRSVMPDDEDVWTDEHDSRNPLPVAVQVATVEYFAERGTSDASLTETFNYPLPASVLVEGLSATWRGDPFTLQSREGAELFVSVADGQGRGRTLWVARAPLLNFLNSNDLVLTWTILSETRVLLPIARAINGDHRSRSFSGVAQLNKDGSLDVIVRAPAGDAERETGLDSITTEGGP